MLAIAFGRSASFSAERGTCVGRGSESWVKAEEGKEPDSSLPYSMLGVAAYLGVSSETCGGHRVSAAQFIHVNVDR